MSCTNKNPKNSTSTEEVPEYEVFLDRLSQGVLRELGGGYEARSITNTRNNGITRRGILIRRLEDRVAPAIYLDGYYEDFCGGTQLSDIVRDVLYIYRGSAGKEAKPELRELNLSRESILSGLTVRIISYDRNADLLQELPHIRFLNLAAVFQIVVYRTTEGMGTIRFTREHYETCLRHEGRELMTPKELFRLALNNTEQQFPAKLSSMELMLQSLAKGEKVPGLAYRSGRAKEEQSSLYVLTNSEGINGAGCLLYPGLLKELLEYFRTAFYILPSSIHEVLLLPAKKPVEREELNDMIREINLTQVPQEEVLSDCAYHSDDLEKIVRAMLELPEIS